MARDLPARGHTRRGTSNAQRIQRIRPQGQCRRPRHRRDHRQRLRQDRRFDGRRRDHADRRFAHRRSRLLQQIHPAEGPDRRRRRARDLCQGQGSRRHRRLRPVPDHHHQLPDHRLRAVPGGQGHEPPEAPGRRRPGAGRAAGQDRSAARGNPRSPQGQMRRPRRRVASTRRRDRSFDRCDRSPPRMSPRALVRGAGSRPTTPCRFDRT